MKTPHQPSWLSQSIIYEVYPQTFKDSNGDGIGDLPGVIEKLDYIQSLGCNTIWLNPCFESPFGDAGYDISDFRKVAPRYGTNDDMIRLFRQAHAKGMRVILDLVAGHTSVEHPWFKASAQPQKNKYTNWYVWTDNVWADAGKDLKTVQGFSDRDGKYVNNFFHFQPALNFGFARPDPAMPWQLPVNHPDVLAVGKEIVSIMRYWMDRGADGFRVDMASSLVKNDPGAVETMKFWRKVRAVYDRDYPDCALISEWSYPEQSIAAGFHVDFMIHYGTPAYTSLFRKDTHRDVFGTKHAGLSFFDRSGRGDIREFLDIYERHYRRTRRLGGHISMPTGNHDIGRISMGRSIDELKVVQAFLLTMPGIPCLYYGDEIGMRYVSGLASKEGGYGRTGSRTPMQWDHSANSGFSKAPRKKLYLPIDPAKDRPTVVSAEKDPASLLHHWRELVKLRANSPALSAEGTFRTLYARKGKYPFVYLRKSGGEQMLVAVNPSGHAVAVDFALAGDWQLVRAQGKPGLKVARGRTHLELPKVSYAIYRKT